MDDITKQKGGDVSCILSYFYLCIYILNYCLGVFFYEICSVLALRCAVDQFANK